MTTTDGALTLSGLGQRTIDRRPFCRSEVRRSEVRRSDAVVAQPVATAAAGTGLLSDRAMIAFVVMKETAAAVAITALVLAAILL